ncbi:hypothetical protein HAX54_029661 [Datura stramonium]|uniref:Palmitoyl-protein thioesterase 1-like n=1 Tax=Datura stramonium TaxID=4076 RepID=A0ABS8SAK5_DATST|nr:hypothetical protein [Datura stramonium]
MAGLGQSCNDAGSTFYTSQLSFLSRSILIPEIGNGAYNSYNMPLENQKNIERFEELQVKRMKELVLGYNLVGLSQGNMVARGLIEFCVMEHLVKNYPMVGPNAGVASAPACVGGPWCAGAGGGTSGDIAGYLKGCRYFTKLNNEIPNATNPIYKQRFTSLQNLVLIMFENDDVVIPKESSWFGFYQDGTYSPFCHQ